MKHMITLFIAFITGLVLSGCASNVYFETEAVKYRGIDKSKRLGVVAPNNPTVEEINFQTDLKEALRKRGYNVVSQYPVDYQLLYSVNEKSYSGVATNTSFVNTTSTTTGYLGGVYGYGMTTSTVPVTNTYSYTNVYKKIYLQLGNEKIGTIWSGLVAAESYDYDNTKDGIIEKIADLVGKNLKGYVSIGPK